MNRKPIHFAQSSKASRRRSFPAAGAYTLVEVLIAAAIVAMGVAAAAALSLTMIGQQVANARVARALNSQEQACRLFQLGLDQAAITNILPREPGIVSLQFSNQTTTSLPNVGTAEVAICTMTYNAGTRMTSAGTNVTQTNAVPVVRPDIR